MTATPIPRTLSMALADLREMSIIATPPAKRQSIQTFVQAWNPALVREACLREMRRGGQIYVLFNDVEHIGGMADELATLIPNARIGIAHGQMPERQLERVMRDFYHQQYNILLCTTIIETGIDVPNANTILIARADKFGLAQLHQLRGRVGRSHHKAYAYLFTPDKTALSGDAQKRLDAISKYDQLGSGFALATQDLEIRGAGELLGHEQSGQMQEIGFDLYSQLLDRAVRAYRRGDIASLDDDQTPFCDIDLGIAALIPDNYLPDVSTRLVLYKRINSADTEAKLHELQVEMVDRFGLLPVQTQHLFKTMQLKHQATSIGIKKIDANAQQIRLTFANKTHFDPTNMIKLLQTQPRLYKMDGPNKFKYMIAMKDASEKLIATQQLLSALLVN
jgi:transcription-repair coupling factor (superfamily II helicase)